VSQRGERIFIPFKKLPRLVPKQLPYMQSSPRRRQTYDGVWLVGLAELDGGVVAWSPAAREATAFDCVPVEADLFHSQAKAGKVAAVRTIVAAKKRVIVRSPRLSDSGRT
jgi:hypothetical protein